jgi:hypothetical protein
MAYDDYDEEDAQEYDDEQDEPMLDDDGNDIAPGLSKSKKNKKGGDIDDNVAYFDMEAGKPNLADDGVFEGTPKDPADLLVEPTMDVFVADDSTDIVPVSYR